MRVTATLGYARVSTIGQDLAAQLSTLAAVGVDAQQCFTDQLSGSAKSARPGLAALLGYARPGDTVVVTAIDRLGRSVAEVTRTIADLEDRGITLRALRKALIPVRPQAGPSPPSWPPWPSWNLNLGASVVPHHASLAERAVCQPLSRLNSPPNARTSCAASPRQGNRSGNSPKPSESDAQPPTATCQ